MPEDVVESGYNIKSGTVRAKRPGEETSGIAVINRLEIRASGEKLSSYVSRMEDGPTDLVYQTRTGEVLEVGQNKSNMRS